MARESLPNYANKEKVLGWILLFQQQGDEAAQLKLVTHYRYLVESIARKYSNGKSNFDDIFQVGMIGLLGAIRRFDPSYGRSFEAFAVPTIIGEIKRYLRDKTWDVHVPRWIKEIGPRIKNAAETLTVDLQRSPSILEIAQFLGVSEEEVLEAMEIGRSYQALSMDHAIEMDTDGGAVTLFDVVGKVDEGYDKTDRKMVVSDVLGILSEREQKIIQLTYLEQLSQKEAGEQLGISQMHVSRIQRKALKKLHEALSASEIVSI